jgi:hypothetical protein
VTLPAPYSSPGQGAYKTLLATLRAAPALEGVSVIFGEEFTTAQEYSTPMVTIVPVSSVFQDQAFPAYAKGGDPNNDNQWMFTESVNLVCWTAVDPNSNPAAPDINEWAANNADAVENLRVSVLQALQTQTPGGLRFVPKAGQWSLFRNQQSRYGRAFVLQVDIDITYTTEPYVDAPTPITVDVTTEIEA